MSNAENQAKFRKSKEKNGFKRITYYVKEQHVEKFIKLIKKANELNENEFTTEVSGINRQLDIVIGYIDRQIAKNKGELL